jgi:hypothetical protein
MYKWGIIYMMYKANFVTYSYSLVKTNVMCQIYIIYHVRILLDALISPLHLVQIVPMYFFVQKLTN